MYTKDKAQKLYFVVIVCAMIVIATIFTCIFVKADSVAFASFDIDTAVNVSTEPAENFTNVKYISNSRYFLLNPKHHSNTSLDSKLGVCTTVALQMLLGYHNYYSDRRLIPAQTSDGKQFLCDDYGNFEYYPEFCDLNKTNSGWGKDNLGTEDSVFDEIIALTPLEEVGLDQMLNLATKGAKKFIEEYSAEGVNASLDFGLYNQNVVVSELEVNRPVVLGMSGQSDGKPSYHVVVAYGYATYQGEFGYIVHWGHEGDKTQMWAPAKWFSYMVPMNVEHSHSWEDQQENVDNVYRVFECSQCACRKIDSLYLTNDEGDEIIGLKYAPLQDVVIPTKINNVIIRGIGSGVFKDTAISAITLPYYFIDRIGANAFENCVNLQTISIPYSVTAIENGTFKGCTNLSNVSLSASIVRIGDSAFENCTSLSSITFPNSVEHIGNFAFRNCVALSNIFIRDNVNEIGYGAFAYCDNLNISVSTANDNFVATDNVLYNHEKTELIATGKIDATFDMPDFVIEIAPYAFCGNSNLQKIYDHRQDIAFSDSVFADCENLEEVYFYFYDLPTVSATAFANGDFTLYVPYSRQAQFRDAFAVFTTDVRSVSVQVSFVSDGNVTDDLDMYYGAIIEGFPTPEKTGYDFVGWYDNADCEGTSFQNGAVWDFYTNKTLYAKWTPKQFFITFAGEQSENLSEIYVTYDESVGTLPSPQRDGYTFIGWKNQNGYYITADTVWQQESNDVLTSDWQANSYTISYDGNGGTPSIDAQTVQYDSIVSSLATCQRIGFAFLEWNTAIDGSGQTISAPFSYTIDDDVVLYAQWQIIEYSITYDLKGGIQTSGNPNTYTVLDNIVFEDPAKTGHSFVNWTCDGTVVTGINQGSVGNIAIVANWAPDQYIVSLNANGGICATQSVSVTYESIVTIEILPTRVGYVFDGWYDENDIRYTDPNGNGVKTWDKPENAVLYARWSIKTYEIQINDNGSITWLSESGFSNENCTIEYGTTINSINLIAIYKQSSAGYKEGMIFDHFEYENSCLDWSAVPDLGENNAVVTIVPVWIPERHTIHFTTFCSIVCDDVIADFDNEIVLPTVSRNGYVFNGWYMSTTGGEQINWSKMPDLTPNEQNGGSITLFARYTAITYTVTYDLDGGINSDNNPKNYTVETAISLSSASKTGYLFDGWYLDANRTERIVELRDTYGNKMLYAKWTPIIYSVKYNANGGSGNIEDSIHTYDIVKNLSNNSFTRKGYSFVGWAADANGVSVYSDAQLVVNLSSTNGAVVYLYAKWAPISYTVVFNANGGTGNMSSESFTYDVEKELIPNEFEKIGYDFDGWATQNQGEKVFDNAQNVKNLTDISNGNVILYAVWIPQQYNVTLDKQYGQGGTNTVIVTYDNAMPEAIAPTRQGYVFKGYYSQTNGNGSKYYDGSSPMQSAKNWDIASSTTLYAYWEKIIYTVTVYRNEAETLSSQISVRYGEKMPELSSFAPVKNGYEFVGYFSQRNGQGKQYYSMALVNDDQSALIYQQDKYFREKPYSIANWDQYTNACIYPHWKLLEYNYNYENIASGQGVLGTSPIYIKHGVSQTVNARSYDGYSFKYFDYAGKQYQNASATISFNLVRNTYTGQIMLQGSFFAVYEKNQECVAEGTMITLADGTQKPVEQLTGNEMLLVWNMFTGAFDSAPILFIDSDPYAEYEITRLSFSDGTQVKLIYEHGFWDFDLNKYVYLRNDAAQYIGHTFNKQTEDESGNLMWTAVELVAVDVYTEYTTAWSPVTYGHLCYYVNGMLSMPGGITGLFNIFDVDGETLKVDEESMAADIAKYGLYTYEEFAQECPVPQEMFEAVNGQYLKVAIGKGNITMEEIIALAQRYAEFFYCNNAE